jgi:hypothetical protein
MISNIQALLDRVETRLSSKIVYPESLLHRFNLKSAFDREIRDYLVLGGAAGGYYHWLTRLAQEAGPALIVELGNRHGTSTIALYAGLHPESRMLSLDVMKDQRYIPDQIFSDPRVRFLFGDGLDVTVYERSGIPYPLDIDILWTDTVHTYQQVSAEFSVYEPLLADEAVIAIDDIHLNDKNRFFNEAPYEKRDLTTPYHASGFGVLHYVRPPGERGKSPQDRALESLRRSARIGYEHYWDLLRQYESLRDQIQSHPALKVQRRLVQGFKSLFGKGL